MPTTKLATLANPTREFNLRGQTLKWRALTLADLAEIEARYGSIHEFFNRAAEGSVAAVLEVLARALNATPDDAGKLFLAGDFRENAPAHQLLMQILEASGIVADAYEKKEPEPNQTGQESTQ